MNRCIKCGNKAVRCDEFMIGGKDVFSFVKFDGAAKIGICGNCAKPYAVRQLNKLLLIGIGTFTFGLFFLIIALTDGLNNNIWAFAIMITSLGSGFMSIIGYIIKRKKISVPEEYLKEMEEGDYYKLVAKLLDSNIDEIKDNVIINWSVLNNKRNIADFSNPDFLEELRTPFKVGINGNTELYKITDITDSAYIPIPGYGTDKSLDKEGQELIRTALLNYKNN